MTQEQRASRTARLNLLGHTVLDLRLHAKMTMLQLEARSGVHHSSISRIENGKNGSARIETLNSIAVALKVPLCRLFDRSHILPDPYHADPEVLAMVTAFRGLTAKYREEARNYLLFLNRPPIA